MARPSSNPEPTSLLRRLVGAVGVGGLATLVDLLLLVILVELFALTPTVANIPALIGGALVQFVGCRSVVFRTGQRSLAKSLGAFALVEVATLLLNAMVFAFLVSVLPAPYALIRLASTFLVFAAFSFPAWHWVFDAKAARF